MYLVILLTHTVLAAVIVPLALLSLTRALKGRFELHRKVSRWTWPIWMYVSVTGVMIYLLLYQIFPQQTQGPPAAGNGKAPEAGMTGSRSGEMRSPNAG